MSKESERETARGLRTLGNTILLDLIIKKLSPEAIAEIFNEHVANESSEVMHLVDSSKKKVAGTFTDSRRVFRDAFRRNKTKSEKLIFVPETGALAVFGQQPTEPMIEPVPVAPTPEPIKPNRTLSPMEQTILIAAGGKSGYQPSPAVEEALDPEVVAALARAADENDKLLKLNQDFIEWVCDQADTLLKEHKENAGEALWANPIRVMVFPKDPSRKVTFVLSSTAPMIRNEPGSPNVKHDFRADEHSVNHTHPNAFRQRDGMKVIRSKVHKKGIHEYYVKALDYVNGMPFKGYFEVERIEAPDKVPPRYYQIRWDRVVRITEEQYRTILNRKAAGKPLLDPEEAKVMPDKKQKKG